MKCYWIIKVNMWCVYVAKWPLVQDESLVVTPFSITINADYKKRPQDVWESINEQLIHKKNAMQS